MSLAGRGYAVGVNGTNEARINEVVDAITDAGGMAIAAGADVASATEVDTVVTRVEAHRSAVDVLVNCADTRLPGALLD